MKKLTKQFLLLLLTLNSFGCSSQQPKPVVLTKEIKVKETVNIDPALLQECDPLPLIKKELLDPKTILTYKRIETSQYIHCALMHSKLVGIVKDAFNIKEAENANKH